MCQTCHMRATLTKRTCITLRAAERLPLALLLLRLDAGRRPAGAMVIAGEGRRIASKSGHR